MDEQQEKDRGLSPDEPDLEDGPDEKETPVPKIDPRIRNIFLCFAGAYLCYLAWELKDAVMKTAGGARIGIVAAQIVFVLVGVMLIYKNVKYLFETV